MQRRRGGERARQCYAASPKVAKASCHFPESLPLHGNAPSQSPKTGCEGGQDSDNSLIFKRN
jgi:hypothetical protein